MRDYLTVAEVLAMHTDLIERYGGSPGVRDQGLLEAALHRPQTGYYAGLIEEAAALWESLAQNHAFIDGNKRTAFAAMYTFLAINGARLAAGPEETYTLVAALYEVNQFSFDKLVPWLRNHVTLREREDLLIRSCEIANSNADVLAIEQDWEAMVDKTDQIEEPWNIAPAR